MCIYMIYMCDICRRQWEGCTQRRGFVDFIRATGVWRRLSIHWICWRYVHVKVGSPLQCAAVCCSVSQCVAVCCSVVLKLGDGWVSIESIWFVLQRVAACSSISQRVAVCGSVLQCVAACCCVLQCVAVCCSLLQLLLELSNGRVSVFCVWCVCCSMLQFVAACDSLLQCVTGYIMLHCVAVCCSMLQCATGAWWRLSIRLIR